MYILLWSRLVWDVSTNAITARVQGITYLQNHRSERPESRIPSRICSAPVPARTLS
jgi:hypothetical protein